MPIPPPNFNRPIAPVPGAIPRPGGVPARPPGAGGIPPRPGVPAPATQALPSVATSTSALHPVQTSSLNSQRAAAQPDAAQEFVMQFKKQLLPYLVQALDPKLLERGNEGALDRKSVV